MFILFSLSSSFSVLKMSCLILYPLCLQLDNPLLMILLFSGLHSCHFILHVLCTSLFLLPPHGILQTLCISLHLFSPHCILHALCISFHLLPHFILDVLCICLQV